MKLGIKAILILLLTGMVSGIAVADSEPPNWDAKAVEVLKQMDAYTDSMQTFLVQTESYNDASIGPGMIISNPLISRIAVDRIGSLHSTTKSGSESSEIYVNKGKLTVYTGVQKFYTHADLPKNLSEGLLYALAEFDVETPLVDLLIMKSLDSLVTPDQFVVYVTGDSPIRGVDCHHILVTGALADMQIWVEKGDNPVPRRMLLRYKQGEGMPRHDVFIDWQATDGFDKTEFEFVAPEGAQEIGFIKAP
jgi:hypothetical protein